MKLAWRPRAVADLVGLRAYIAEDNPQAAASVAARIGSSIDKLASFPEIGRIGRVAGTRELVVPRTPYIVAYVVSRDEVVILAIIHAARKWPEML